MINTSRLRKLRGTKKQRIIAAEIGISQNHYSQIENGIKSPSLDIAIRIAQYFDVLVDDIVLSNPSLTPLLTAGEQRKAS